MNHVWKERRKLWLGGEITVRRSIFLASTLTWVLAFSGDAKSFDAPWATPRTSSPEEIREGYEHSIPFDLRLNNARNAHDFLKDFMHEKYKKELIGSSIYSDLDKKFLPRNNYVGWKDINGDGIDELFLFVSVSVFCGSIGCPTHIFQRRDGKWFEIGEIPTNAGVNIGGPVLGGYQTIYAHDACALWNRKRYLIYYDDPQDGDHIDPHACGRGY